MRILWVVWLKSWWNDLNRSFWLLHKPFRRSVEVVLKILVDVEAWKANLSFLTLQIWSQKVFMFHVCLECPSCLLKLFVIVLLILPLESDCSEVYLWCLILQKLFNHRINVSGHSLLLSDEAVISLAFERTLICLLYFMYQSIYLTLTWTLPWDWINGCLSFIRDDLQEKSLQLVVFWCLETFDKVTLKSFKLQLPILK